MSRTLLIALHILSHLSTQASYGVVQLSPIYFFFYPHFKDEETKAQVSVNAQQKPPAAW